MSITKISEEKLKKLGIYIKEIRKNKKIGTNQLATKMNISPSYITRLEKGQIATAHPYLLKKVAQNLRIDYKILYKIVGYLDDIDYTEEMFTKSCEILEKNEFNVLVQRFPKEDIKEIFEKYLEKKEYEAYKNGTYKKNEKYFKNTREMIEYGLEKLFTPIDQK